jgi:hypothetical protein
MDFIGGFPFVRTTLPFRIGPPHLYQIGRSAPTRLWLAVATRRNGWVMLGRYKWPENGLIIAVGDYTLGRVRDVPKEGGDVGFFDPA